MGTASSARVLPSPLQPFHAPRVVPQRKLCPKLPCGVHLALPLLRVASRRASPLLDVVLDVRTKLTASKRPPIRSCSRSPPTRTSVLPQQPLSVLYQQCVHQSQQPRSAMRASCQRISSIRFGSSTCSVIQPTDKTPHAHPSSDGSASVSTPYAAPTAPARSVGCTRNNPTERHHDHPSMSPTCRVHAPPSR